MNGLIRSNNFIRINLEEFSLELLWDYRFASHHSKSTELILIHPPF